jgi:integrase
MVFPYQFRTDEKRMARESIDKASTRSKLEARREPYWGAPVTRGLYVGFRKLPDGAGTWVARWRDQDGRQRYHSVGLVTVENDYDVAKRAALRWMKDQQAGVNTSEVVTVREACELYVRNRRQEKGEATARDAELRFARTVYAHPIGDTKLQQLRQARITDWRDALVNPTDPDRKPMAKASANRTLTSLKAALNLAASLRYVSPERTIEWDSVKPYSGNDVNRRRDLYLDLAQRRALRDAAAGGIRDLIEAAMLTGARAGELTSANAEAFDKRSGTLRLSGKTGSRTVPLSPAAVDLFERLRKGKLPKARMLTRDDGKPWGPSDWDKLVREAAERAKLPAGVCLYTLRHSWITTAILEGLTPLEVARLVGTSLAMIDKHYGHLAQTAAKERLAKVSFI